MLIYVTRSGKIKLGVEMNIFSIYFYFNTIVWYFSEVHKLPFELQMPFSQNDVISDFIFCRVIFSELSRLQSYVIYHFKGDNMKFRDILITPIFKYMQLTTHFVRSGHIDIYEWRK